MTPETASRVVAGTQIEIVTIGSGPPLLYLHAADGIEGAMPLLEQLGKSFRVYAPSHPGFGGSTLPAEFGSVDDLAYFYLDLLDDLNLSDVVLMGSSFGGWIAAEIAVRNTARLSHLVLAAPVGVKFGGRETRDIADLFAMTDKELGQHLYAAPRQPPDYSAMTKEAVTRIVQNRESFTLYGWAPTLFNPKLRQRLHRIDIPALLLSGASDRVLVPGYADKFAAAIRGSSHQKVPGAGHYLHADRPIETAAAVTEFFARRLPARRFREASATLLPGA